MYSFTHFLSLPFYFYFLFSSSSPFSISLPLSLRDSDHSLDCNEKSVRLLQFVTGTYQLPVGGLVELMSLYTFALSLSILFIAFFISLLQEAMVLHW